MVKRAIRRGYLKLETYWPNPKGVISEPKVVTTAPTPCWTLNISDEFTLAYCQIFRVEYWQIQSKDLKQ